MTPIHHPLSAQDREMMIRIRELAAPAMGVLEPPSFDAVIEQTPPAHGVTCEKVSMGDIVGWWCRPPRQTPGAAILSLALAAKQYLGNHDSRHPRASPLYARLRGLPPSRIEVGEDEILLDDARRYAECAVLEGGTVHFHAWEGMPHVLPANVGVLGAADAALKEITSFLRRAELRHGTAATVESGGLR